MRARQVGRQQASREKATLVPHQANRRAQGGVRAWPRQNARTIACLDRRPRPIRTTPQAARAVRYITSNACPTARGSLPSSSWAGVTGTSDSPRQGAARIRGRTGRLAVAEPVAAANSHPVIRASVAAVFEHAEIYRGSIVEVAAALRDSAVRSPAATHPCDYCTSPWEPPWRLGGFENG